MKPYYEQDGITIYHGDCRDVLPTLEPVDLVLTDPPYGIERFKKGFGTTRFSQHEGVAKNGIEWDVKPTEETLERVVGAGTNAIVWGYNNLPLPLSEHFLVWDKFQTVDNFASAELAYINAPIPAKVFRYPIHQHNRTKGGGHPTEKPVSVMKWCIEFFPDAATVLDPFMGSGTTLRAAKDLGRKATGIEIEERYCEIAANRMRQTVMAIA